MLVAPIFPVALVLYERKVFLVSITIFLLAIYGFVLFPVSYKTLEKDLLIRPGVLKTRIRYSEIQSLRASKSKWSSQTLSLDRIEIRYGRGSSVWISPKEKMAFLEDIRKRVAAQTGILLGVSIGQINVQSKSFD